MVVGEYVSFVFFGFLCLALFGCSCLLLRRLYDSVYWVNPNSMKFTYFRHSLVDACNFKRDTFCLIVASFLILMESLCLKLGKQNSQFSAFACTSYKC